MHVPVLGRLAAAFALFACIGLSPQRSLALDAPRGVVLQMHVGIPMRDGTRLNATLYRPEGPVRRAPVIFILTPYAASPFSPSGSYFAAHGLNYVYVDVRGRGDSEGVFVPFAHDAQDGYDVVEWLAKQPWSDGRVAMFGASYPGGNQWQVAATHPPHLAAIAPGASVRAGVDFPIFDNVSYPYTIQWLTLTSRHALYTGIFVDNDLWAGVFRRLYREGIAFSRIDAAAGNPSAAFQTWIAHPSYDAYWRSLSPTSDDVANIKLPALVITGARDTDQYGTLSFYRDHLTAGTPPKNYFLVIGPWDHEGTRIPKQDIGGEHFGPASLLDVMRLHLEWYRYVLLNGAKPAFFKKNVAYYVSGEGAECWKYADSLAGITTRNQTLFLNAAGGATNLYRSGTLQETAKGITGGAWISDPSDLSHEEPAAAPPGDDLHGDGLVFHSAPFAKDVDIAGRVALRMSLAIDGPDADIGYRLYLVTPDGKAHLLDRSFMRARYRHSLEHAELVKPGEIDTYDIPASQWFAVRAPKGSRLRLIVESINDPMFQKNWNAAKPVAQQSSADAHRERIRLVQTPGHPSMITIPYGDTSAACTASASW